jgi:HEAT repeat protein
MIKSISRKCRLACAGLCLTIIGCGSSVDDRIAQLGDKDVETRRAAVRALQSYTMADNRIIAAFAQATADNDAEVQRLSIDALGNRGLAAMSSLPALRSALTDDDSRVRVRAALAICRIAPDDAAFVPVLTSAMRDGDGRLLQEVGTLGEDAAWAVPTVIELLSHQSAPMRALAAQTLGRIGVTEGGVEATLGRASRDSNVAVQAAAKDAMRRIRAGAKDGNGATMR